MIQILKQKTRKVKKMKILMNYFVKVETNNG